MLGLSAPELIFAAADTHPDAGSAEQGSKSRRPIETVTPLAAKLGLAIQRTLEAGGVVFIPENGGGAGVRLPAVPS